MILSASLGISTTGVWISLPVAFLMIKSLDLAEPP